MQSGVFMFVILLGIASVVCFGQRQLEKRLRDDGNKDLFQGAPTPYASWLYRGDCEQKRYLKSNARLFVFSVRAFEIWILLTIVVFVMQAL